MSPTLSVRPIRTARPVKPVQTLQTERCTEGGRACGFVSTSLVHRETRRATQAASVRPLGATRTASVIRATTATPLGWRSGIFPTHAIVGMTSAPVVTPTSIAVARTPFAERVFATPLAPARPAETTLRTAAVATAKGSVPTDRRAVPVTSIAWVTRFAMPVVAFRRVATRTRVTQQLAVRCAFRRVTENARIDNAGVTRVAESPVVLATTVRCA